MLSIHNDLLAGTQNVTGAYVIITLVYRRLLNNALTTGKYFLFPIMDKMLGMCIFPTIFSNNGFMKQKTI